MADITDIGRDPVVSSSGVPQFRALPAWERRLEIVPGGKVMAMQVVADVATNHVFWLLPELDIPSPEARYQAACSVFKDQIKGVFVAVIDPLPGVGADHQCPRCGHHLPIEDGPAR